MRRTDREIRDINEIIQVMERCDVCRLALNDAEGYPYILPLNFGMRVEDGQITLYFHGAETGRKYELLARDSRVSFEMDRGHRLVLDEEQGNCTMEYESVIGRGRVDILPEEEKMDALRLLMAHYRREDFPFNPAAVPHTVIMRLRVEQLTGKRRAKERPAMGRGAE
ncbi:MAG: pyridoxamine 5'-phosphate oxidase family protein [Oscillospiraceae bacterium]|nr:pyridoxamine 5'-phosphate oxidase family protein [Oscillospiraceae bacterium]